MRRRDMLLFAAATTLAPLAASAQPQPLFDVLTQADAGRAVREALGLAAVSATSRLARRDGFFGDARVHIPLPGALGDLQRSLGRWGLSGALDDLELSLNRAAEAAMPQAAGLFADAVRTLTLSDAIAIVRGPQDSATAYLRGRTETRLARLLRPPMTDALTASGAFTLLQEAAREFRMSSRARALRTEVIDFSVAKALDGAFAFIADEERAIRRDPFGRGSDTLRRAFGPGA